MYETGSPSKYPVNYQRHFCHPSNENIGGGANIVLLPPPIILTTEIHKMFMKQ